MERNRQAPINIREHHIYSGSEQNLLTETGQDIMAINSDLSYLRDVWGGVVRPDTGKAISISKEREDQWIETIATRFSNVSTAIGFPPDISLIENMMGQYKSVSDKRNSVPQLRREPARELVGVK